jgi:dipeptidyl aminopeptidase/acylaminoacyl peptidase
MNRTTKFAVFFLLLLLITLVIASIWLRQATLSPVSPLGQPAPTPTPKPLLKYTFDSLRQSHPSLSPIQLDSILISSPYYTSYLFTFTTEGKRMSGQLNVPTTATPSAGFPVIVMIRGFVDPGIYQTGVGTKNAAAYFASHGFATLSPDFLGYGQSDPPAADSIAARLEKPKNVLDLIASIPSLKFINSDRLGLWGHSNGGQIALSVLEITGKPIPTSLWAPVSKGFPYSILYYTDESDDQGKALRKVLADFEVNYDVFDFSIDRFIGYITAPILVHQGTADDAVPLEWSKALVDAIKVKNQDITLFIYPGADHNLRPAWDTVVARDVDFFAKRLKPQ